MITTASPLMLLEPSDDGPAKAMLAARSGLAAAPGCAPGAPAELPGAVGAAVVHDHDLVGTSVQAQFQVQMLDGRRQRFLLIAGGNHHLERSTAGGVLEEARFLFMPSALSCHLRS